MCDLTRVQRWIAVMTGVASLGIAAPALCQTPLFKLEKNDGTSVLQVDDEGGLLAKIGYGGGAIPASGAGLRLMWWPSRSALRAGAVSGSHWDDANVGYASTAIGENTTASAAFSLAIGQGTTASGEFAIGAGHHSIASGRGSTAMGVYAAASSDGATSFGSQTTASGQSSTAFGFLTTASGTNATAMGEGTTASGRAATALGEGTYAQAYSSLVLGSYNVVEGNPDVWVDTDPLLVVGNGSYGSNSNALTLLKNGDLRVGRLTTSSGVASGWAATAIGEGAVASGDNSTAIGPYSNASGLVSAALGNNATATGFAATAIGQGTTAQASHSLVVGSFNAIEGDPLQWNWTDPLFVVGAGQNPTIRVNALILRKNGDLAIGGTLTQNSDARLKTDVHPLVDALSKLEHVRGVTFRFRDEHSGPSGIQIGLLAQEVQDAFPELVREGGDGRLSVAYGNFTAVLLEAIKEQQRQIEELRERVAMLEAVQTERR